MTTSAPLLGEPIPVELMNTVWADHQGVHDALGSPAQAGEWLRAIADRWEFPSIADEGELPELGNSMRRLRDAARSLAARQTADDRAPARSMMGVVQAIQVLNGLAASAPTFPALSWPAAEEPTLVLVPQQRCAATISAELARATVRFFSSDARLELRSCDAPGCVLYFVKGHPRREWCSAACGNRARVARHYRRHRL